MGDITKLDRQAEVARLSLEYMSQHQIAEHLGVSQSTVSRDLAEVKAQWLTDAKLDRQAAVMHEVQSINRLESRMWEEIRGPLTIDDLTKCATTILRCKERRAKMLGLDSPDLLAVTISDEALMAEIIEIRTELGYDDPQAAIG